MNWKQIAVSVGLVAALAAAPLSRAQAQAPCPVLFPLCIPFAVVGAAATVATAPFRAIAGAPPYYYAPPPAYYYPPPAPAYYGYYGRGFYGRGYYGRGYY